MVSGPALAPSPFHTFSFVDFFPRIAASISLIEGASLSLSLSQSSSPAAALGSITVTIVAAAVTFVRVRGLSGAARDRSPASDANA